MDIITRFITKGGIFIDYLKKRIEFKKTHPFLISELVFLDAYLKDQSFKNISLVNPKHSHDVFDKYFLLDGDKPILNIGKDIYELISFLENSTLEDKVEVIQTFLSLNKEKSLKISKKINEKIKLVFKNNYNQNALFNINQYSIEINFLKYKGLKKEGTEIKFNQLNYNHKIKRIEIFYDIQDKKYLEAFRMN